MWKYLKRKSMDDPMIQNARMLHDHEASLREEETQNDVYTRFLLTPAEVRTGWDGTWMESDSATPPIAGKTCTCIPMLRSVTWVISIL